MTQDCSEEQPVEVKQAAAEVLVRVTPTLLTSDTLPIGRCIAVFNVINNKNKQCSNSVCVGEGQVLPIPWHCGRVSSSYCRMRTRM